MNVIDSIVTQAASIAAVRRDIHAHPELCFEEVRTADVVAAKLTEWGIPVHRGMGTTGVVGIVHGRDGGASGRAIGYQDIPPEAMLQGLLGAGLPRPYAEFLVLILGFFKAGYSERTTDAVQTITGRAPRGIEAYVSDYRAAWLG